MKYFGIVMVLLGLPFLQSFQNINVSQPEGSYVYSDSNGEEWLMFKDNYFIHTSFNKALKQFHFSRGGTYKLDAVNIHCKLEFDTRNAGYVGKHESNVFQWKSPSVFIGQKAFKSSDNGSGELAGYYRISARKQGDDLNAMPLAARKTIKLLTGERFQWAAINTSTGEFFGTGGGRYTFENGLYTEYIEFFSRDSSRVGASLQFADTLKGNQWIHSGKSSKGNPIYEVWSREPITF